MTHPNSSLALATLDLSERERLVMTAYSSDPLPVTDRHIMRVLGYAEKNQVSPRITALVQRGLLEERGNVLCPETGKRVRLCAVKP